MASKIKETQKYLDKNFKSGSSLPTQEKMFVDLESCEGISLLGNHDGIMNDEIIQLLYNE